MPVGTFENWCNYEHRKVPSHFEPPFPVWKLCETHCQSIKITTTTKTIIDWSTDLSNTETVWDHLDGEEGLWMSRLENYSWRWLNYKKAWLRELRQCWRIQVVIQILTFELVRSVQTLCFIECISMYLCLSLTQILKKNCCT